MSHLIQVAVVATLWFSAGATFWGVMVALTVRFEPRGNTPAAPAGPLVRTVRFSLPR